MFDQMTLWDSHNAISSQESESGATRSEEPAGPTSDPSGPAVVRANLSARQAKAAGLLTSGTSGRRSIGSLNSVDLQRSLENKLQARLQGLGSTLYKLTWKRWDTPSRVSRFRLRPSVLRTSVTERTGWVSPSARDWKDTPGMKTVAKNPDGSVRNRVDQLPRQAAMAGPARLTASGQMLTGSSVGMENGGQLNPAHSRWLMGLPIEWDDCAVTAMQSMPKRRKSS